jgi:hypothetical protein
MIAHCANRFAAMWLLTAALTMTLVAASRAAGLNDARSIGTIESTSAFQPVHAIPLSDDPPPGRYLPLDESGGLLIIAYDPWLPNVQPLVDHKNSLGIPTTAVGVSTIGNNVAAIKAYIQNVYNTSHLSFVLLVGDAEQVATPHDAGGPSDPVYSLVAGNDNYPDIMVGRFSAETAAQVDTQVQRTIEYELQPAPQQAWFWRAAGIGSDTQNLDAVRAALLADGYTLVDQLYDPGTTPAMIAAALNDGRGLITYIGQASTTAWWPNGFSIADVNALTNDHQWPFIFNLAPECGYFEGTTCLGEAWLRAQHDSVAVGAIGAYMSSVMQFWTESTIALQEFVSLYLSESYVCLGTLCFGASCRMIEECGPEGVQMFKGWILFGDPSLRVVGAWPRLGDLNCNGSVGFDDINPFVRYLSDFSAWQAAYPGCPAESGDINGDGTYPSFGDINPFVALLTGGG